MEVKSFKEIYSLKQEYQDEYMARHEAFRRLRSFWHGTGYWEAGVRESGGGLSSIFRDLTGRSTDVGPDIKLVHNLLQEVCVKFQTFLSPLPMISVYADPPESNQRRAQATKKERYLYGLWAEGGMTRKLTDASWYLPLFGHSFFGIFPDFDNNICRPILRSPEHAFPIPSFDGHGLDAVIFSWRVREQAVERAFPNYVPSRERNRGAFRKIVGMAKPKMAEPEIEVIEYSDKNEFCRYADEQKLNGVYHGFNFNLWDEMKYISVPDEVWGHGAVEQAVNMVEMGNALYSLLFQAYLENVFPRLILENPMKFPEEIDTGAGAVIGVNEGGKAYFLTPPGQALASQTGFLIENARMVKEATSMPDVNFGKSPATSIVTGKAINELQGAGTGSMVEMVQGTGIGPALAAWNEKAIFIGQEMFRNDEMHLFGIQPSSYADANPRRFALNIKGKELVGSGRNEVVFMPHMDKHEKIVMGLQMAGAGLVSKKYQREQVGIPDSQAMDEEILSETIQDAVLASIVQGLQMATSPEAAVAAEEQGLALLSGQTSAPTAPVALPGGAGPLPPQMPGPAAPPGGTLPAPPGAPASLPAGAPEMIQGPPAPPPPGTPELQTGQVGGAVGSDVIPLNEAIRLFQGLEGVEGRIFLVGEIVVEGQTDDDLEVTLTDPSDQEVVVRSLPNLRGRLVFHHVPDEPDEEFVEVTPGALSEPAGAEPAGIPEALI